MSNFDSAVMEAEIRRLADEFPVATYKSTPGAEGRTRCYYNRGEVIDGPPEEGCIFGHAARNVLPQFYLIDLQEGAEEAGIGDLISDSDAMNVDWFMYVQDSQDNGLEWEAAVHRADERVIEDRENGGPWT